MPKIINKLALAVMYVFAYFAIWIMAASILFFTPLALLSPERMALKLVCIGVIILIYCAAWLLACLYIKPITVRTLLRSIIISLIVAAIPTSQYWIYQGARETGEGMFYGGVPLTIFVEDVGPIVSKYGEMTWGILCSLLVFLNSFGIISIIAMLSAVLKQENPYRQEPHTSIDSERKTAEQGAVKGNRD